MKKYCFFGLFLFLFSCAPSSQDADFKVFIKSFHQSKLKQFPVLAFQAGHLKFLKSIPIPDQKKHASNIQFCKNYSDSLQFFNPARLSKPLQFEYNKIEPFLAEYIHDFEVQKIHKNDPTYYDLRPILLPFRPEDLELSKSKLKAIPAYFLAAKQNLVAPDRVKTQTAIEQQIRFYKILDEKIPNEIRKAKLTDSQTVEIESLLFEAKLSVKDFIAFCESAAFENIDEALNSSSAPSKVQFKKVFNLE